MQSRHVRSGSREVPEVPSFQEWREALQLKVGDAPTHRFWPISDVSYPGSSMGGASNLSFMFFNIFEVVPGNTVPTDGT